MAGKRRLGKLSLLVVPYFIGVYFLYKWVTPDVEEMREKFGQKETKEMLMKYEAVMKRVNEQAGTTNQK